jgi:ribonuclease-3
LVNRAFLTQLINETGLHRFIKSRTIGSSTASNILGDALEALIGAIYLDKGFETARYVIIKRFLNGYVDLNKMEEQDNNYKSQLIEWGQKNKQEVSFQTEEENSPNSRFSIFVTTVEIENHLRGKGYGSSKKESQQNAACEALKDIDDESLPENH